MYSEKEIKRGEWRVKVERRRRRMKKKVSKRVGRYRGKREVKAREKEKEEVEKEGTVKTLSMAEKWTEVNGLLLRCVGVCKQSLRSKNGEDLMLFSKGGKRE